MGAWTSGGGSLDLNSFDGRHTIFCKPLASLLQVSVRERFHGFNGQFVRANILLHLIRALDMDAFWETGTYLGETPWLIAAQTAIPVATCEMNQQLFELACKGLEPVGDRVETVHEDSCLFLRRMLKRGTSKRPFVYLDAHGYKDLPLREEIELIAESGVEFLIVVDDFKVPTVPGFGFDVYGALALDSPYIRESVRKWGLSAFQPAYPSQLETPPRRGFIVLTRSQLAARIESAVPPVLLTEVH